MRCMEREQRPEKTTISWSTNRRQQRPKSLVIVTRNDIQRPRISQKPIPPVDETPPKINIPGPCHRVNTRADVEFFTSVTKGDAMRVKGLLTKYPHLVKSVEASDGKTALHFAATAGHLHVVLLLIEASANIDSLDTKGFTALHCSTITGHRVISNELLKRGAKWNFTDGSPTIIQQAAIRGDFVMVQQLLEMGAKCYPDTRHNRTALHHAARFGYRRVLEILLTSPSFVKDINLKSNTGKTALHLACEGNRPLCVSMLIEKGARLMVSDLSGYTPLHIAAKKGNTTVIDRLLRHGHQVDTTDKKSKTALYLACAEGLLETMTVLLSHGASVVIKDTDGIGPLMVATKKGLLEAVQLLVTKSPKDGSFASQTTAALEYACNNGLHEIATFLVGTPGTDISAFYSSTSKIIDRAGGEKAESDYDRNQVDDYGFIISHPNSKQLLVESNPSEILKQKEVRKCQKALRGWIHPKKHETSVRMLRESIIKGKIPIQLRGQFWKLVLGIEGKSECRSKANYKQLLKANIPNIHITQLHKDLERALRPHKHFVDRYGDGQKKLFRIMRAYAAYYPAVGYGQGMCTIGAILLMVVEDELETFYGLISLFQNYSLLELYSSEDGLLPGLQSAFTVFEKLLEYFLPKVKKCFDSTPIPTNFYLTQWFLEIFFGRVPFWLMIRLWDLYMLDGYSAIYSFTLSLLALNEQELSNLSSLETFNPYKEHPALSLDEEKILQGATTKYRLTPAKILSITGYKMGDHRQNVQNWSNDFFI